MYAAGVTDRDLIKFAIMRSVDLSLLQFINPEDPSVTDQFSLGEYLVQHFVLEWFSCCDLLSAYTFCILSRPKKYRIKHDAWIT